MIKAARLSRLEHRQREADVAEHPRLGVRPLGEHARAALEDAPPTERVVSQPRRLAHVHDEPAVGDRCEPGSDGLQVRLVHHDSGCFIQTLGSTYVPCPASKRTGTSAPGTT